MFLFFVSIFLIQPGEELVEIFFLLNSVFFILCPSEGVIILCNGFQGTNGQTDDGACVGCCLGGFILAFLLIRIIGVIIGQLAKSRNSPDTSADSTADEATVIPI